MIQNGLTAIAIQFHGMPKSKMTGYGLKESTAKQKSKLDLETKAFPRSYSIRRVGREASYLALAACDVHRCGFVVGAGVAKEEAAAKDLFLMVLIAITACSTYNPSVVCVQLIVRTFFSSAPIASHEMRRGCPPAFEHLLISTCLEGCFRGLQEV